MRFLFLFVSTLFTLMAQQTRTVDVTWTASVSSGVLGYSISTGTVATGPFVFRACTGTVTGQTCVTGSTATTTTYTDTQTVGGTIYYQVNAVAAPCTTTTPVTQACGASAPVVASTTVPPQPGISTVVLVVP
jgi:hypothetical protein